MAHNIFGMKLCQKILSWWRLAHRESTLGKRVWVRVCVCIVNDFVVITQTLFKRIDESLNESGSQNVIISFNGRTAANIGNQPSNKKKNGWFAVGIYYGFFFFIGKTCVHTVNNANKVHAKDRPPYSKRDTRHLFDNLVSGKWFLCWRFLLLQHNLSVVVCDLSVGLDAQRCDEKKERAR